MAKRMSRPELWALRHRKNFRVYPSGRDRRHGMQSFVHKRSSGVPIRSYYLTPRVWVELGAPRLKGVEGTSSPIGPRWAQAIDTCVICEKERKKVRRTNGLLLKGWFLSPDGEYVCAWCERKAGEEDHPDIFRCPICTEIWRGDDSCESQTHGSVCPECIELMIHCEVCEREILELNANHFENGVLCSTCRHTVRICPHSYFYVAELGNSCPQCEMEDNLHPSRYVPTLKFLKKATDPETPIYFGCELEVDASDHARYDREAAVKDLMAFKNVLWLTEDGTISHGFEVTTHPLSERFHVEDMPWEAICKVCENHGFSGTSNAGLHIHESRKNLKKSQLVKLGLFVYSHRSWVEGIARRPLGRYSPAIEYRRYKRDAASQKGVPNNGRTALAFHGKDTVEWRMFASTINSDEVKGSVEFVAALTKWVNLHGAPDVVKPGAPQRLLDYARETGRTYFLKLSGESL